MIPALDKNTNTLKETEIGSLVCVLIPHWGQCLPVGTESKAAQSGCGEECRKRREGEREGVLAHTVQQRGSTPQPFSPISDTPHTLPHTERPLANTLKCVIRFLPDFNHCADIWQTHTQLSQLVHKYPAMCYAILPQIICIFSSPIFQSNFLF